MTTAVSGDVVLVVRIQQRTARKLFGIASSPESARQIAADLIESGVEDVASALAAERMLGTKALLGRVLRHLGELGADQRAVSLVRLCRESGLREAVVVRALIALELADRAWLDERDKVRLGPRSR